ncbi:MAG: hypothetical protein ACK4SY_08890 [Pyrobaculum sp.]
MYIPNVTGLSRRWIDGGQLARSGFVIEGVVWDLSIIIVPVPQISKAKIF